jgi:DNA-binding GntR family transcriptional regulator
MLREVQTSTRVDQAIEVLRDAILSGLLVPGERLTQNDLAERLGISPTPIREALRQLEAEGIIERTPHKGVRVTEVDSRQIREIYHLRMALEGLATRWAAPNLTADDFDALDEMEKSISTAVAEGRLDQIKSLNYKFHFRIYERAKAPTLLDFIRRLWPRFFWPNFPWDAWEKVPGYADKAHDDHKHILTALRRGDGEGAQKLLEAHIAYGAETVLNHLAEH